MYKIALGDTASLTLEGGLRYVIVNSNVEFVQAEAIADAYGNYIAAAESIEIDFDDGIVGVVGADFDLQLGEGFYLFAGAGYQFDVLKGDITVGGINSEVENELNAIYARAGITLDI